MMGEGEIIERARRAVARCTDGENLIGVTGSGAIHALQAAVEALLVLVETHHSRLHAIELRKHGFDPHRIIG
jgi:hypothetical protein